MPITAREGWVVGQGCSDECSGSSTDSFTVDYVRAGPINLAIFLPISPPNCERNMAERGDVLVDAQGTKLSAVGDFAKRLSELRDAGQWNVMLYVRGAGGNRWLALPLQL